ncbi:hypothetical protein ABEB36_014571 [Hypothenemus hampei]|uniref:Uncharacterized protein n=1 Tax=Hypothenemus hampei TaxID=57062 RepID=A0ABD1E272_HYPHA
MSSGMSADDLYESTAWWFSKLSFLKEHIKTRKTKSNLDVERLSDRDTETTDCCPLSETSLNMNDILPNNVTVQADVTMRDETRANSSGVSSRVSSRVSSVEHLQTPCKRKLTSNNNNITDEALGVTLTALKNIQVNHNKLLSDMMQSRNTDFGKYVSKELDTINDEDLLNDAKFEINTIIFRFKKKQFERDRMGIYTELI